MLKVRVEHTKLDISAILREAETAERVALQQVLPLVREVMLATVGTRYYSLHQLAAMGHPYGYGRTPPMHPGVINKQSGDFYRGFIVAGPVHSGNQLSIFVSSTDSKSDMLLSGRGRMIARPYDRLLQWKLSRVIAPVLGSAMSAAIKIKVVK